MNKRTQECHDALLKLKSVELKELFNSLDLIKLISILTIGLDECSEKFVMR
jgi:uncharacterized protein (DUF1810 family)